MYIEYEHKSMWIKVSEWEFPFTDKMEMINYTRGKKSKIEMDDIDFERVWVTYISLIAKVREFKGSSFSDELGCRRNFSMKAP